MDEFKYSPDLQPFHSSTATDSSSVTSIFRRRRHHRDTDLELDEDYNIARLWSPKDQISPGLSRDCSARDEFGCGTFDLQRHREFEQTVCRGRNAANQANTSGSGNMSADQRYSNVQMQLREDTGSLETVQFGDYNGNEINFHAQSAASDSNEHVIEIVSPKPLDQLVAEFNFSSLDELDHVEITLEMDENIDHGACGEIVWIDNNINNPHKCLEINKVCNGGDIIVDRDQYNIELIHNTARCDQGVTSIAKRGFPTSTSVELCTEDLTQCPEFAIESSQVPDESRRNLFNRRTKSSRVNSERFYAGASTERAPQYGMRWNGNTYKNINDVGGILSNRASSTPRRKHLQDASCPIYDHRRPMSRKHSRHNKYAPKMTETLTSNPSRVFDSNCLKYYENGFKCSSANYSESNDSFNFNLRQIYEHTCVPNDDPCQYCQALKESGISLDHEPNDFDTVPLIIDDLFIKECIENDDSCPYCEILWYNDLFNEKPISECDLDASTQRDSLHDDLSISSGELTLNGIADLEDWSSVSSDESPASADLGECYYTEASSFTDVICNDREPDREDPPAVFVQDVNYDYEYEELGAEVVMNEVHEEGKSFLKVFNGKFAGVYEKVPNLQGVDGAILIVGCDSDEPTYYVDETLAPVQQPPVTQRLFLLEMYAGPDRYHYGVVRSDGRKLDIESKTPRGAAKPQICCIGLQELQQLTADCRRFEPPTFDEEAAAIHGEASVPPLHIDDNDGYTW